MNNRFWVAGAVVLSLVALVAVFVRPSVSLSDVKDVVQSFGAFPGTDIQSKMVFQDDMVVGGKVFATSSVGAVTYTAAQVMNNKLIQHTAASAVTATLPASTTMSSFLPKAGDTKTLYINAITSAVTLAGGTGMLLSNSTTTAAIAASGMARLDFVRKANRDIQVLVTYGGAI